MNHFDSSTPARIVILALKPNIAGMPLIDFTQPFYFLSAVAVVFIVVFLRYLLVAGLFHFCFYSWRPSRWQSRKVGKRAWPKHQLRKEINWSMMTSLIFAFIGAGTAVAWQKGWLAVYEDTGRYGWVWFFAAIGVAMVLHETAYYWLHRWMHHPKIYPWVHKVHHDSRIPSPWTAFSFHPIEGFLEGLILPLILAVVPMHLYAVVIYLTLMTLSSVVNHLDIEIYPKWFARHPVGKWLIGATHHSHHHRYHVFNYGLYFTFWDKWLGTESPDFEREFAERAG